MSDDMSKNELTEVEGVVEESSSETPVATTESEVEAEAPSTDDSGSAPEGEVEQPVAAATTTPTASAPASVDGLKPGMEIKGKIKTIELYGAFVDIGVGKDALLHISQLGKPNVRNVEDVVKAGEEVTVYVLKVEPSSGRIALSMEKPPENPIGDLQVGQIVTGKVVRIETFGAFVDIGAERPGMIHVSELASDYIQRPEDVVKLNDEVQAKVIKVNRKKRQIDLSIKALDEEKTRSSVAETSQSDDEPMPTAMELALRRAMAEADEDADIPMPSRSDKKQRNSHKKKQALNEALARTLKSQES